MPVAESIAGHYEVEEVAFGLVYRWCPECVVIECGCGKKEIFTPSSTVCIECGADHAEAIREELAERWLRGLEEAVGEEDLHPWRYADREGAGLPY